MSGPGSDDEFVEFMEARWRRLVYTAILLGCSADEAEDITQVTLMRCMVAWPRIHHVSSLDAYVSKMLLNDLRASRRRRWRGERPTERVPDRPSVVDAMSQVDSGDAVERALGRLTQGQREVVVLRFWCHLAEREVAETLGIAVGTVKSRLSRALSCLAHDQHLLELVGRAE